MLRRFQDPRVGRSDSRTGRLARRSTIRKASPSVVFGGARPAVTAYRPFEVPRGCHLQIGGPDATRLEPVGQDFGDFLRIASLCLRERRGGSSDKFTTRSRPARNAAKISQYISLRSSIERRANNWLRPFFGPVFHV